MNTSDTGIPLDRRPLRYPHRTNYKEKLRRGSPLPSDEATTTVMEDHEPTYARQVQALARHADAEGVSFQCIAAAALDTLERVLYRERRAAEAALSLAQQEKLNAMVATVAATAEALRTALTPQGQHMLRPPTKTDPAEAPESSWWFALSEALHALNEGLTWVRSVAAGQPRGSAAYTLSNLVAHLLGAHYREVLAEAEHWMS